MFSVLLLLSFCFFDEPALANRVDGAKFAQFKDNKPPSISEVREWFETPFTRYLVAPVQLEPHFQIGPDCYVGGTILRHRKRQDTRIRKLRQLLLMQPVHAELMLHWQVSRKKFSLVVLLVAHMDTQRQIRNLEMTLIQRWNPSLNFPFSLKNPR